MGRCRSTSAPAAGRASSACRSAPPCTRRARPARGAAAPAPGDAGGSFLRTLAAEPERRQLWAGAESGIRVWALDEVFAGWGAGARRGDEESAPFREGMPAPPRSASPWTGLTGCCGRGTRTGGSGRGAWTSTRPPPRPRLRLVAQATAVGALGEATMAGQAMRRCSRKPSRGRRTAGLPCSPWSSLRMVSICCP